MTKVARPGRPRKDPEVTVSRYFQDYAGQGKPTWSYMMRRLGRSLRALIALCRLPCLRIAPSAGIEGAAICAPLLRNSALWRVTGLAAAVLSLPHEPGQYSLGAPNQTLRRKVRQARRLGIYWAEVMRSAGALEPAATREPV
jgi:hypothetical protein